MAAAADLEECPLGPERFTDMAAAWERGRPARVPRGRLVNRVR